MLKTTSELLNYRRLNPAERNTTLISAMVNIIVKYGSKSDAEVLLPQYLTNPQDFDHSYLLPVFKKWGGTPVAEARFRVAFLGDRLKADADPEIMEVLGHLQYAPVMPILADFLFKEKTTDYYISAYASLGLLHFDCSGLQKEIKESIEDCYGKNLFPEFVPALVCKLKDRQQVLENLYELGNTTASTDCNAGIILGFSLCEEEGIPYFMKILFDPDWETGSSATGTVQYVYKGLKNLEISFKTVYEYMISASDSVNESLDVFFALLRKRINDPDLHHPESFADLYTLLFTITTGSQNSALTDLAEHAGKRGEADELENLLLLKVNEEVLLKNFIK